MPFVGDLTTASVFVLMLNPGLHPVDFYAEESVPEYRATELNTLRGSFPRDGFPFYFLQPEVVMAFWIRVLAREVPADHAPLG